MSQKGRREKDKNRQQFSRKSRASPEKEPRSKRNTRLLVRAQLISARAGVNDTGAAFTGDVPCSLDCRAVLSLALRGASAARGQLSGNIEALVVTGKEARKRAGSQAGGAK